MRHISVYFPVGGPGTLVVLAVGSHTLACVGSLGAQDKKASSMGLTLRNFDSVGVG